MDCPDCAAPNPEDAQLCEACGRSLFVIEPGTVLTDRYELQGVLGSGGLGRVYRARDRMLEETVAVKVLHPEAGRSHEFARRFRSEIKLARKVRHRNVCAIHEYGEEGPLRFVAMELVDGEELHRILRERGPLPPREAFDVAAQVTEGLAAIHDAGVIHRDLKTPNIMRDSEGVVRLLDFGIAKLMAPTGTLALTAIQKVVGTPEYMSPEQVRGDELDARSDLYSLGVVLFEIFTGMVPFQGRTPVDTLLRQVNDPPPLYGEMAARIPRELLPLLARTLSKRPEDRPASARVFLEALDHARQAAVPEPLAAPAPPADRPITASRTPPPLPKSPPIVRTAVLPRRGGPAEPGRAGGPGTPPPRPPLISRPPLTPRPPVRTAREDAAAAALDASRTYVELEAPSILPVGGGPGRGRPPVLPDSSPARPSETAFTRLRWTPAVVGLGVGLALVVLWLAGGGREAPPPPEASATPSPLIVTPPPVTVPSPPVPTPVPDEAAAPPLDAVLPSLEPDEPEAVPTPSPRTTRRPARRAAPTPTPTPSPTPSPTPALAVLDLDVRPFAEVTAGDRALGRTPIEGARFEPGPVVLLIQHPGYWPLRRHVFFEPGRRTRLQIDLEWEAVVRRKSAPYEVPRGDKPDDPYFLPGVRLVAEGDFQDALLTLDPVVRRLEGTNRPKELARAEFFLGVALLELGREAEARARFESALDHDSSLKLEPDAFPARVTSFFGHVRDARKARQR